MVDLALAARELAAELTAVLALAMLSVSPSSAPILSPLTHETVAVEGTDRLSCPKRRVRHKILIGGCAVFLTNIAFESPVMIIL